MIQRFYIYTSIFGGLFDLEFEKETTRLFEKVKLGQVICVYSNLTESELSRAPLQVRRLFEDLDERFKEKIQVTPEALILAQEYINPEYALEFLLRGKNALKSTALLHSTHSPERCYASFVKCLIFLHFFLSLRTLMQNPR